MSAFTDGLATKTRKERKGRTLYYVHAWLHVSALGPSSCSIMKVAHLLLSNWIVAIVRFTYVLRDLTAEDRPWIAAETFLWSVIEVNTGLMCGCIPVLKPFFLWVIPKDLTEKSWSFGRSKNSWNSETLRGDIHSNHDSYIELERGKERSHNASVSTDAEQPEWPIHGHARRLEARLHGDHLDDGQHIAPFKV